MEKTLFELRKDFNFVLLGPLTLKPSPFPKLGRVSSGKLTLQMNDMICESKGGSVGAEGWLTSSSIFYLAYLIDLMFFLLLELQCWEASNDSNPLIMTFKDIKSLSGGGLGRRLTESDTEHTRNLSTSSTFQFNCILSETDVR